jgi:hypothetical protein
MAVNLRLRAPAIVWRQEALQIMVNKASGRRHPSHGPHGSPATKTAAPRRRRRAAGEGAVAAVTATRAPDTPVDDGERVVERPDGYHWIAPDGRQEFGPFDSVEAALADMASSDEEGTAMPANSLQDVERDIGIADWIDPDTGEPAEGQSPPHLDPD